MSGSVLSLVRDLHRRKARERRGRTLAEGIRLVEEVQGAGVSIDVAVVSPALEGSERGRALKARLVERGVPIEPVSDEELDRLATTEQTQGVLAVIRMPPASLDALRVDARSLFVVLDALQDPGNVGTIVRTALAFGVTGLIALPGTAEVTSPKTLRASMGAAFHLPVVSAGDDVVASWLARHRVTVATASAGGDPFEQVTLPRPAAIVLGNEGAGARSRVAAAARHRLAIPLRGGVESLNVAVAAGILLHGVARD